MICILVEHKYDYIRARLNLSFINRYEINFNNTADTFKRHTNSYL